MLPPGDGLAPVVANWFRDPRLHASKDDLGRSTLRHGLPRPGHAAEPPGFAEKLALLGDLRTTSPDFFSAHDYGWALDGRSYLDPAGGDVADQALRYQLTVLRTLVGAWEAVRGMRPRPALGFDGVCARHAMSSNPSPTCRLSGGFGYLIVPFCFRRLTRELLHALCGAAGVAPSDGPRCFARLASRFRPDALGRLALPFVARWLGLARSDDMANQHGAEDFLLTQVPAFAGARLDLREGASGTLDAGLHELLMSTAVNHELGHLLYRHGGRGAPLDEEIADSTSLDVSLRDWGWLADHGAPTGLPDPIWMLLGPPMFFWAAEIVVRLDALVDVGRTGETAERLRILSARKARVDARVAWLVREVWPRFGVAVPDGALEAVAGFRATLDAAAGCFSASPLLVEAVRAGRERLGPGYLLAP